MVGRSMMNIMIYIQQNYLSHFKDIKVDEVENEALKLKENLAPLKFEDKNSPNIKKSSDESNINGTDEGSSRGNSLSTSRNQLLIDNMHE